jgi:DNA polymerase III alpha subunit (gram-positive type)
MNSPKLCFIDVETTGIDRNLHNIFQISARIVDPKSLEICSSFDSTFRPLTLTVQADALDKHGYSLEDLGSLPTSSSSAYSAFVSWLSEHVNRYDKADKLHFVAYNAKFDSDFVRSWFEKHDDAYFGSYFWNPPICVMMGAAWFTQRVRSALPNFKLATLCQCAELSWDESQAHDASYDIDKTIELYRYLNENLCSL